MSLFSTTQVTCPKCQQTSPVEEVGSINADRRPDLRQAILDGTLQTVHCPHCGHDFRLEPDLNYMDARRGQWIAAYPLPRVLDHLEAAAEMRRVFDKNFGPAAGHAAHELGKGLVGRVVFGWAAMREKLLAHEAGLDDLVLELLKLDLLRDGGEIPFGAGPELRMVEADDEQLTLAWYGPGVDDAHRILDVEVSRYQDIVERLPEWQPVADALGDSPFVDFRKLYFGRKERPAPGV